MKVVRQDTQVAGHLRPGTLELHVVINIWITVERKLQQNLWKKIVLAPVEPHASAATVGKTVT